MTWNGSEAYFQCNPLQVSFFTPQHPVYADTAGNSTDSSNHPAPGMPVGNTVTTGYHTPAAGAEVQPAYHYTTVYLSSLNFFFKTPKFLM